MFEVSVFNKYIGLLTLGVAVFGAMYSYNERLIDWLKFQSIGTRDYVHEKLQLMFIDIPPEKLLIGQFAVSFGLGSVVFLALLPQWLPGILLGAIVTVIGWKAPKPIVDYMYRKRVEKFGNQMVDALGLMANGMKSGLSVVQAIGLVVQEMENPIRQEFELLLNQNKMGVSIEEAFTNLSKRVVSDDVEMFVTSVNILKETGGNLAETFDTIVTTIRDRIKVEGKIKALTSQAFFQGMIVLAVPPALGVMFYVSDPAFMAPLFTTTIGWIVILIVLGLEVAGFFLIMKVIKIDV